MLRVARGGGGAHHCEAGLVWDVWDKEQNERQWGNQKAKPGSCERKGKESARECRQNLERTMPSST